MPNTLPDLPFAAYEHPADHAAFKTLRAIPGFDEINRRIASWFGERSIRHLFTANAVRVGATQYPQIDALLTDVLKSLDFKGERPQLYIRQSGDVTAYAVGFDSPFIVLNSALVDLLDRDELRFMIAHEVGHIASGRTKYRTIALIILMVGVTGLPFLAGLALFPFQMALLEWYRKAEMSADRAALLATQDTKVAQMTFFKLAGGGAHGDTIDLGAFVEQSREYQIDGGAWDKALKVVNSAFRDHPFATVRVAELMRYIESGSYARIVGGDYSTPEPPAAEPKAEQTGDLRQTAEQYANMARDAVGDAAGTVAGAMSRARDAFNEAFRNRGGS